MRIANCHGIGMSRAAYFRKRAIFFIEFTYKKSTCGASFSIPTTNAWHLSQHLAKCIWGHYHVQVCFHILYIFMYLRILHIFNINGKDEPQDLFYDTTNTYHTSLYLSNCAMTLDKDQTCTLTESQPLTGIVGIFKSESTRQFTFSFSNVDDLDQFKTFL